MRVPGGCTRRIFAYGLVRNNRAKEDYFMKQRSIKTKLLLLSAITVIAVTAAYGSLAYFTAENTAKNTITAGDVKIELQEKMISPDGEKIVPFENQLDVMPGCTVSKIVQVKNTGGQPAWIRVSIEKAIELAENTQKEIDLSLVSYQINTAFWTEKDGYYYYNNSLAPGETTEPLLEAVDFSGKMSNAYQNSKAILTVNAYATQTAHNGISATDADGWPQAK